METDLLIVGGGPAGLAAALRFAQLNQDQSFSVTVLEKGAEIGHHILSGNCFQPTALNRLVPDWQDKGVIISHHSGTTPHPCFNLKIRPSFPNQELAYPDLPASQTNPQQRQKRLANLLGNYLISLGQLCKWLADQAEEAGADIFPGFAGDGFFMTENGAVGGVVTKCVGVQKNGEKGQDYDPGMVIKAKQTLLTEGCRGSLSEFAMKHFELRGQGQQQEYGIGLKEVWRIDTSKNQAFKEGLIKHTVGWPLGNPNYGGSFLYCMNGDEVHLGLVVGLDYQNPYLNPYEEFQRLKLHPDIKKYLEQGECIAYGARCLNEGGYYAIPKLTFPGGALAGCSAGFLDVPKIKGSHNAMETGMLAAESIYEALKTDAKGTAEKEIEEYEKRVKESQVYSDLYASRNFKGGFHRGLYAGLAHGFVTSWFTRGREWWKLKSTTKDSARTQEKEKHKPIDYPPHDGQYTFDLLSNLQRSGTNHNHDQPAHLVVREDHDPLVSLEKYAGPEQRFCPAKVYEFVESAEGDQKKLQINAQNCLHCKCCSIKMVGEYIDWNVPEGGGGPAYSGM